MTMFSRNDKAPEPAPVPKPGASTPAPIAAAPTPTPPPPSAPAENRRFQMPATSTSSSPSVSVISKALKITGQLESTEDIQIEGEVEGDVRAASVKVGTNARVKGTVYGDEVELSGSIEGKIEAKKVVLNGTARMTGDIVHHEIKVEAGAYISGTLTPELGKSDTKPALKPVTSASTATVSPMSH